MVMTPSPSMGEGWGEGEAPGFPLTRALSPGILWVRERGTEG